MTEPARTAAAQAVATQGGYKPDLSVVLVTLNEIDNLEDVVTSLIAQEGASIEVLVVDGGSSDGTDVEAIRLQLEHLGVVRLVTSRPLPIGPARNLGIQEARADRIAFVSADTTVAPGWARAMVRALDDADVVYGRQEHAPPHLNVPAVVRGLRYHHFRDDHLAPAEAYASNVNAAVRRSVFDRLQYVSDGPASALDDILFTREARQMGLRVAYRPDAVVHHKDAASLGDELTKNRREGYGWGLLSPLLGYHNMILAWLALLVVGIVALAVHPAWWTGALLAGFVYAPAVRRVVRAGGTYWRSAPLSLMGALAVSPLFDLAFLFDYLRGLRARRSDLSGRVHPTGAIP